MQKIDYLKRNTAVIETKVHAWKLILTQQFDKKVTKMKGHQNEIIKLRNSVQAYQNLIRMLKKSMAEIYDVKDITERAHAEELLIRHSEHMGKVLSLHDKVQKFNHEIASLAKNTNKIEEEGQLKADDRQAKRA